MATPKYQVFYDLMIQQNRQLFEQFQSIHDAWVDGQASVQETFHVEGQKVLDVVRDWERRLCHGMEKGRYAAFSAQLSEKFWQQVKKTLPMIESVGLKIKK